MENKLKKKKKTSIKLIIIFAITFLIIYVSNLVLFELRTGQTDAVRKTLGILLIASIIGAAVGLIWLIIISISLNKYRNQVKSKNSKQIKVSIIFLIISLIIGVASILINQYTRDNIFGNPFDARLNFDQIKTLLDVTEITFYFGIAGTVGCLIWLIVALYFSSNNINTPVNTINNQKFCKNCGGKYDVATVGEFCDNCGAKL